MAGAPTQGLQEINDFEKFLQYFDISRNQQLVLVNEESVENISFNNVIAANVKLQFLGCEFNNCSFNSCSFPNVYFEETQFDSVYFSDTHFTGNKNNYRNESSNKGLNFSTSKACGRNNQFRSCIFENCSFNDLKFTNIDFGETQIKNTFFNNTIFKGDIIDFRGAIFMSSKRNRNFNNCIFSNVSKLNFQDIKWLNEDSPLLSCIIKATELDFSRAKLECSRLSLIIAPYYLSETVIKSSNRIVLLVPKIDNQQLDLFSINIKRGVKVANDDDKPPDMYMDFSAIDFAGDFEIDSKIDKTTVNLIMSFENVDFNKMARAKFRSVSLKRTRFFDAYLENVDFIHCEWPKKKEGRLIGSQYNILFDEEKHKKDLTNSNKSYDEDNNFYYRELVRLYTDLKSNYERKGDRIQAGTWFYREMEAKRNSIYHKNWPKFLTIARRKLFSYIALYKIFSDYGTNCLRPFLWLISIITLFPLIYLIAGIEVNGKEIRYIDLDYLKSIDSKSTLNDYTEALAFGLSNIYLHEGSSYSKPNQFTKIVSIFHKIISSVIAWLLFISLKNRYKSFSIHL